MSAHPLVAALPRRNAPPARLRALNATVLITAAVLAIAAWWLAEPHATRPRLGTAAQATTSVDALQAFRQHWMQRTYEDPAGVLPALRAALDEASRDADRHARWLLMAWLLRTTAVLDVAQAEPLYAQAEAEIARALGAGDRIAAFELAMMVESGHVQHLGRQPDAARLQLLQGLAADIGGPLHEGLMLKLRGLLASQAGQDGDAQVLFEQALQRLTGRFERAELQMLMALSWIDHPTDSATQLAIAYLEDIVRAFPLERYPGLLAPTIRLSLLLSQSGRPLEAWQLAERAVQLAEGNGLAADRAQARVARAQALLAAGDYPAALADFGAAPMAALSPADALPALAGQALCQAHLATDQARMALLQARQLGSTMPAPSLAGRARFHETLAAAWQLARDPVEALHELRAAAAIRQTLAETAQARLAQAHGESLAQDALSDASAGRRAAGGAVIGLLTLAVIGMATVLRRQHHAQRLAADRLRGHDATHQQLHTSNQAHAHQLEAICQALRRPARALALLTQSDTLAASSPDLQRAHLQAAKECSLAFGDTVDALLDLLRLQEGRYVPQPERFDLTRLLDEIGRRIEPRARRQGLQWQLEAPVCGVFTDPHLLRRILLNLLEPLLSHARHGTLGIHVQPLNGMLSLSIHCSGLAQAPWLDDTAAPESAARDELGLGPATARLACELLGHPLTVMADGPGGLTLRITLPDALPPPVAGSSNRPAAGGRSVALVEDDAFSRITLMNALVDAGLDVQAYASFDELMARAGAGSSGIPGVLISDLHLGDHGDATDALRALRRRPEWRDVPVLMLTGDIRDEVGTLATELGVALAYKPISVRRLLERIALLRSPQPLPAQPPTSANGPQALPAGTDSLPAVADSDTHLPRELQP